MLALVLKDTIRNIFEFDQGLTSPIGPRKWNIDEKIAKLHLCSTKYQKTG
jgi:hypothetical protein